MKNIITIDGYAGCKKTTLAARIANILGIPYISAGKLYRLFAYIHTNGDADMSESISRLIQGTNLDNNSKITFEGCSIDKFDLGTQYIGQMATTLANNEIVINTINQILKTMAEKTQMIVDGRNLGNYVFEDAIVKVFVKSDIDTRMNKWVNYHIQNKIPYTRQKCEEVKTIMERRDYQDEHRLYQPLSCPSDAIVVDVLNTSVDSATRYVITQYLKSYGNVFNLTDLSIKSNSIKIEFIVPQAIKKYLNENWLSYDFTFDVSSLSKEVALSPFIMLLAPIIWCTGMIWAVDYMDKELNRSLKWIKRHLEDLYGRDLPGKIISFHEYEHTNTDPKQALYCNLRGDEKCLYGEIASGLKNLIIMDDLSVSVGERFNDHLQLLTNKYDVDIVSSPNLRNINFTELSKDYADSFDMPPLLSYGAGLYALSYAVLPALLKRYASVYLSPSSSSQKEYLWNGAAAVADNVQLSFCKFIGYDTPPLL